MTYWRRRFLALAAGLTVLAVVAWAFSGVLGSGRAGSAAADGAPAAREAAAGTAGSGSKTGPGEKPGSGGQAGPGAATPRPAASARPSASADAPATSQSQSQATAGLPASAVDLAPGALRGLRACPPGDVVLSLFSSQGRYGEGQGPEFDVDVVSTSARSCAFNIGPEYLTLVIRAHGNQVWSSADCATGRRSVTTELVRGVPAILPVSWNLKKSGPGCAKTSRKKLAGRFVAAASDGSIASNAVRFTAG
jgi:hypothetical protein